MGRPKRASVVKTADGPIEVTRPAEVHLNGMDRQVLPGMRPEDATDRLVSGVHFLGMVTSPTGVELFNGDVSTLIPWHRIRMVRSPVFHAVLVEDGPPSPS